MEVDEIQCKFPRMSSNGSGRLDSTNIVNNKTQKMDYIGGGDGSGAVDLAGGMGRFYGWPSSRIVRVSRASGGKDRHSKVLTSKGLRDRRVRLSVNTAIQFYDLQDRLGFDQPSKAVEWLIKAAADSITELPPINSPFPDTPRQLSDEKRSSTGGGSDQVGFESLDMDNGGDPDPNNQPHQQQHVAKSSTCSSPSETSKGSGLSLSRSDGPTKFRELAKECVTEKEMKNESVNTISHNTSFTELLSGVGIGNTRIPNCSSIQKNPNNGGGGESNFFQKSPPRQWSSAPMDYFSGFFGGPPVVTRQATNLQAPVSSPMFTLSENHHNHHPELQHFSFVPDHLVVPVVNNAATGGNNNGSSEYNLNFTISSANSSGLAGFNRGTLQSNSSSPSLFPHLQRYNNSIDGSAPSFFISTGENHHQFLSPSWYSDTQGNNNGRLSTQKEREKN